MSPSFSAVLLAGGKSSRMGQEKALIEIEGCPLWKRQLAVLRDLSPRAIFLAGEAPDENFARDCTIIPDAQPEAGPLAGLVAALRQTQTPLLLALALDLPAMAADYLRRLLESCTEDRGIIPRVADRFEPLAAVYPLAALPIAQSCLDSGRYALQGFAQKCIEGGLLNATPITAAEEALFFNLNTPEDLAAFQKS